MFKAAVIKEFKLVFRDLHSVLVLFLMPAAFIIIMSLALQDQFSSDHVPSINVYYNNADDSVSTLKLLDTLKKSAHFEFIEAPAFENDREIFGHLGDDSHVYIRIPKDFFDDLRQQPDISSSITLSLSPGIDTRNKLLLESLILGALTNIQLDLLLSVQENAAQESVFISDNAISSVYLSGASDTPITPTAVQQNVPAWLIFSMFFVVIPVSTTLIAERQQGTLARLRAMNISMSLFLTAKSLPYLVINQLQLIIMLVLGIYVVPLLGGDSLNIGNQYFALMLMSLAIGISAMGYALLVAVIAKTTAQAASIGGVGNILLGAVGGVMVPKFVMPDYLQPFTQLSPMSWGLDGILELFLYRNGLSDIFNEILMLMAFGITMSLIALLIFNRKALG